MIYDDLPIYHDLPVKNMCFPIKHSYVSSSHDKINYKLVFLMGKST